MVHLGRPHGTAEKQNPAPKKQATAKSTGGRPKGTKEKFPIATKQNKKPQAGKTRSGASYRGKPVKVKRRVKPDDIKRRRVKPSDIKRPKVNKTRVKPDDIKRPKRPSIFGYRPSGKDVSNFAQEDKKMRKGVVKQKKDEFANKHADMITFLTLHRALGDAMLRNPERYK